MPPFTRRVAYVANLGDHDFGMLSGACNPIVCPIHVFRCPADRVELAVRISTHRSPATRISTRRWWWVPGGWVGGWWCRDHEYNDHYTPFYPHLHLLALTLLPLIFKRALPPQKNTQKKTLLLPHVSPGAPVGSVARASLRSLAPPRRFANTSGCYWGVPSISADDPKFLVPGGTSGIYWRGETWAPQAFLVYLGLQRYTAASPRLRPGYLVLPMPLSSRSSCAVPALFFGGVWFYSGRTVRDSSSLPADRAVGPNFHALTPIRYDHIPVVRAARRGLCQQQRDLLLSVQWLRHQFFSTLASANAANTVPRKKKKHLKKKHDCDLYCIARGCD